jgi:hypothetical protein
MKRSRLCEHIDIQKSKRWFLWPRDGGWSSERILHCLVLLAFYLILSGQVFFVKVKSAFKSTCLSRLSSALVKSGVLVCLRQPWCGDSYFSASEAKMFDESVFSWHVPAENEFMSIKTVFWFMSVGRIIQVPHPLPSFSLPYMLPAPCSSRNPLRAYLFNRAHRVCTFEIGAQRQAAAGIRNWLCLAYEMCFSWQKEQCPLFDILFSMKIFGWLSQNGSAGCFAVGSVPVSSVCLPTNFH